MEWGGGGHTEGVKVHSAKELDSNLLGVAWERDCYIRGVMHNRDNLLLAIHDLDGECTPSGWGRTSYV